jgi:2,4-dienoyl-CoA reductase (NADPH2)
LHIHVNHWARSGGLAFYIPSLHSDDVHISFGPDRRRPQLLAVDNVVVCADQEPVRHLGAELRANGMARTSSAVLAAERAIKRGTELAAKL